MDKRKLKTQVKNFGIRLHDLTKHGAYSYLRYGTHVCRSCILRQRKKCDLYGQVIEYEGREIKIGLDTECPIIQSYVDSIINQVMELPHIKEEDSIIVNQLARAMGFVALANKYLTEYGMFTINKEKKTVDVQPLVSAITSHENLIVKLCEHLGLSPKARTMLKLDPGKLTLSQLIRQERERSDEDQER